jgi:hypothetical protein
MYKLESIRRQPWIGDYNLLVETINKLIDIVNKKKEVVPIVVERQVKDYSFFLWEEVALPFKVNFILTTPEEATNVFWKYAFTYKETNQINDIITKGDIVALEIEVTEEVTEKEKKQEVIFETVKTLKDDEPIKAKKKRGRKPKKKTSWS